mmetsp:Transcript_67276/g.217167  ORF Transcript_67276/g.217167 Transcript_67276/m.217167 type:complete len:84 (-) Transcript_67276:72-323(-)
MVGEDGLTEQQREAQQYVDQHGLDRLVTKLMNGVLADKPKDPKVFMLQWLAHRCNADQLNRAGLQRAPTSPAARVRSHSPPAR